MHISFNHTSSLSLSLSEKMPAATPNSTETPHVPEIRALAADTIPVIDFALLTSGDPHQRSEVIQHLHKACQEWGLFMLVNHGVPESLMKAVLGASSEYFNLPMEETMEFVKKQKPDTLGNGVDDKVEKFAFWRDFIVVHVHPEFQLPNKLEGSSETLRDYTKRAREVVLELFKGISESLGLEECYIEKKLDLESCYQIFAANFYPPCPQPELGTGLPAHTDPGLLTLLIQNGIGGFQMQHDGEWFDVNPLPNSFLVITGNHLEILTNGKYKSLSHRAAVNTKTTRISIATQVGPSLDAVVSPSPELVERASRPAAYLPMKYKEFLDIQGSGKPAFQLVQLPNIN